MAETSTSASVFCISAHRLSARWSSASVAGWRSADPENDVACGTPDGRGMIRCDGASVSDPPPRSPGSARDICEAFLDGGPWKSAGGGKRCAVVLVVLSFGR